jgi:membrane AbrB-like protein
MHFSMNQGWIRLLALSLPLAWGARLLGFPAAFLVGPMIGAVLFSLSTSIKVRVPRPALVGVQALLGCAIARAITSSFLVSMSRNGLLMLLVVAVTILAGALVGWVLVRYGALPGTTAAWGSSPGGASAMIAMAEEHGADVRLVAFMQYLRVILVVLTVTLVSTFLLGSASHPATSLPPLLVATPLVPTLVTLAIALIAGLLGKVSRIPAGPLLVPMILGGALHALGVELVLPPWLLAIANMALGWHVGLGFDRSILRHVLRAIPQLLASSFLLIGLCALSSWMLTQWIDLDPLTAYLATSPGGLDSIAIIALGSQVDISFVMAVQTLRLFLVILVGPRIAKWLCRGARVHPAEC